LHDSRHNSPEGQRQRKRSTNGQKPAHRSGKENRPRMGMRRRGRRAPHQVHSRTHRDNVREARDGEPGNRSLRLLPRHESQSPIRGAWICFGSAKLRDGIEVEPFHCDIYLDAEKAPGGYLWLFPKSEDKVNIGLGIQQKRSSKPLSALLKDWLAADDRFKDIQPLSDDSNLTGSWQVSVRHQNDCLVANGYMICGDAAWFPNPISAGGIGPGLIGGVMAGETAVRAIEANDFSEKQLWQYNLDFVNHYGNKTAGLEIFRMYLQTLNNDQINYGMRHFLSSDEATEISLGEMPHLSAGKKIVKLFRELGSYKAFSGLVFTMSRMRALNELYQSYPKDPAQFDAWKANVDSILAQGRARFH